MDLSLADLAKDPKSSGYELTILSFLIGVGVFALVMIYKEEIFSYFCSGCKKPKKTTETTDLPPPYEPPPTYKEAFELANYKPLPLTDLNAKGVLSPHTNAFYQCAVIGLLLSRNREELAQD